MLVSILFGLFTLLLFYAAYFLWSGKATVFITESQSEKARFAQKFFSFIGSLLAINGFATAILVFDRPLWLAFSVLGVISFCMLIFIFGLNRLMP